MDRTSYRGSVRNSLAEDERDARILSLAETGLAATLIAQRMGVSVSSVRDRLKRARLKRAREAQLLVTSTELESAAEGGAFKEGL